MFSLCCSTNLNIFLDEGDDVVDLYEDDEEEEEEGDGEEENTLLTTHIALTPGSTAGGTVRRSKFARGREHWHRDQQQATAGLDQRPPQPDHHQQQQQLFIKEQQLHSGEQRVSQDDSGIGVGTSLEVLAGLAATTPSPTLGEGAAQHQQQHNNPPADQSLSLTSTFI